MRNQLDISARYKRVNAPEIPIVRGIYARLRFSEQKPSGSTERGALVQETFKQSNPVSPAMFSIDCTLGVRHHPQDVPGFVYNTGNIA